MKKGRSSTHSVPRTRFRNIAGSDWDKEKFRGRVLQYWNTRDHLVTRMRERCVFLPFLPKSLGNEASSSVCDVCSSRKSIVLNFIRVLSVVQADPLLQHAHTFFICDTL